MMKTRTILVVGIACACIPAWAFAARASTRDVSFFTGPYFGAQIGLNNSSLDEAGNSSSVSYSIGPHLGYNLALPLPNSGLPSPLILGADVFATFNGESNHIRDHANFGSNVYGVDFLAGMPMAAGRRLMPYFKLGFGAISGTGDLNGSDTNVRFGFGAEYKMTRNWGLTAEWMHEDANNITNDDFTVGANYHFGVY